MEPTYQEIYIEPDCSRTVCNFDIDPIRLIQENDGFDSTSDNDESSSSSSSDNDDESDSNNSDESTLQLLLMDTDSINSEINTISQLTNNKQKKSHMPNNPLRDHQNRFQNCNGNPEPMRQKRNPTPKITKVNNPISCTDNTFNKFSHLEATAEKYFQKYNLLFAPSTIYRHLVHKCEITIKRTHPYLKRLTDQVAHIEIAQMYSRPRTMLAAISYFGIIEVCLEINKPGQGD
ncbi:hypothetical protein BDA99DRAFT_553996 [Phascolomyces articulosus]|uniref:Uncharacterized protein n=1 Tax=Phascolomyces articulosus TaxID=60185 RepID=A0AAD5KQW5_9FUNG|nr:hypothetical protein BDA99DRAFT_553996 [Phascolomyces articulosus]